MNESIYKYMKVGLIHFMAYPSVMQGEGPILETLGKIAADSYFNAVEITRIKDPEIRRKAKEMLKTAGMTVAYGAQPCLLSAGLNINSTDEGLRRKAVDTLKACVDEAYEVGASGLAFLSGKYEEAEKEKAFDALVDSTKELCAYAESKGALRIAHEIFDYDIDKKSLIGPASLAAKYAGAVRADHPGFGLLVDLSHLPLLRESAAEAIMPVKEFIVHAHIGNAVADDPSHEAYGDMHPRFGFPNSANGVEELVVYLRTLMDAGFFRTDDPPVLSFEVKPWKDEDPDIVVANAKRVLNESWARL